jgi:hypothetical protein
MTLDHTLDGRINTFLAEPRVAVALVIIGVLMVLVLWALKRTGVRIAPEVIGFRGHSGSLRLSTLAM